MMSQPRRRPRSSIAAHDSTSRTTGSDKKRAVCRLGMMIAWRSTCTAARARNIRTVGRFQHTPRRCNLTGALANYSRHSSTPSGQETPHTRPAAAMGALRNGGCRLPDEDKRALLTLSRSFCGEDPIWPLGFSHYYSATSRFYVLWCRETLSQPRSNTAHV